MCIGKMGYRRRARMKVSVVQDPGVNKVRIRGCSDRDRAS